MNYLQLGSAGVTQLNFTQTLQMELAKKSLSETLFQIGMLRLNLSIHLFRVLVPSLPTSMLVKLLLLRKLLGVKCQETKMAITLTLW